MKDLTDEQRRNLHSIAESANLHGEVGKGDAVRVALKLIDEQQAALNAHDSAVARVKRDRPARSECLLVVDQLLEVAAMAVNQAKVNDPGNARLAEIWIEIIKEREAVMDRFRKADKAC